VIEQLHEMLVHASYVAGPRSGSSLKLGSTIDEIDDCPLESPAAAGIIDAADTRQPLIGRRPTVWDDQWYSTRPSLGGNHAKCLSLATMNERVGARQQTRKFAAVAEVRHHGDRRETPGRGFYLAPRSTIPDQN
jgi:hypothetical protein